ncbi:hypothetical protein CROQUDRAFT_659252 [Cronartium quercuum f. sp. fusiforme G11]|uniref:3'-5' exonuclease domain-containing protein n=1 Tax=Cronartium quercuum f. sp. fusiforme G11 TaxID=708437 RepID=A0A9P6TAT2_9BASI|nr:hypothetical protein CROQUDRAFT_659252 [Cronartium quercuum f. sp. fusiforme G11]
MSSKGDIAGSVSEQTQLSTFRIHDPEWPSHKFITFPSWDEEPTEERLEELLDEVIADCVYLEKISTQDRVPNGTYLRAIAFDMEWAHDWSRRCARKTSVIQLSGQSKTLIIQLIPFDPDRWRQAILPQCLADLIMSGSIIKMGVGIVSDDQKLDQDIWVDSHGEIVKLQNYLEINDLVKKFDPDAAQEIGKQIYSLQRLVARYLNQHLPKPKKLTLSNWESSVLSPSQAEYAFLDVLAVIRIFYRLMANPSPEGHLGTILPLLQKLPPPPSDAPFADAEKTRKSKPHKKARVKITLPTSHQTDRVSSGMASGSSAPHRPQRSPTPNNQPKWPAQDMPSTLTANDWW